MKFVLATANPGKIREMQEVLSAFDIELVTRKELGIELEIQETGSTFLENALLKAKAICEVTGLPAIADDSGFIVDALNGRPGVDSSSYGGEGLSAKQRCEYLLEELKNVKVRRAKFVCTIVCAYPDGEVLVSEGECLGEIVNHPRGSGGFGYDPVFLADGYDKTMAELSHEEKNSISHRGKALRRFVRALEARERGAV